MKWNLQWIVKQKDGCFDFDETLSFPSEMFHNLSQINGLKDVHVTGHGSLDTKNRQLYVDFTVKGQMILPCAVSLEDVDYLEKLYVSNPIVGAIDKNPEQGVMPLDEKK